MGSFIGDLWGHITEIPEDVIDGLKHAAGNVAIGITVVEEAVLVGTPNIIVQGIAVSGPLAHAVTPKTRKMSSEERWLAHMVYGYTLPSFDKIILTNVQGWDGSWFVIPNIVGEILVNIGKSFEDPIRYTNGTYPEFGQVLIHELGHVWQIDNIGSFEYIYEAVPPGEYNPGNGSKSWNDYSKEQQATIVDVWYSGINVWSGVNLAAPCSRGNLFFNHVRDTVNGGSEPPVVQGLSVRNVAKSKFGEEDGFSVSSRFPRQNSGSLRRRLIGLKN